MEMFDAEFMRPYFDLLLSTRGVEQNPVHHPEGDVFIHSLQVMRLALKEATNVDLVFAAMLHDIGKIENTLGHPEIGEEILISAGMAEVNKLASAKVLWLVKNHIRGQWYLTGKLKKLQKVRDLADHPWFGELMQLVRWDRMGRIPRSVPRYDEDKILQRINAIAKGQFDNVPRKKD